MLGPKEIHRVILHSELLVLASSAIECIRNPNRRIRLKKGAYPREYGIPFNLTTEAFPDVSGLRCFP